jgi:hypothetical protein
MNTRYLLLIAAGFVMCFTAAAQSLFPGQFSTRESLIEAVASRGGESADFEAVLNELDNLQRKPLDLNKATAEDMRKLAFLTDFQISSLIDYRKEHGNLLSMNELPLVYGFTDEVIGLMLPYVKITPDADTMVFRDMARIKPGSHEIILKSQRVLEKARGYRENDQVTGTRRYPGNPWLYYVRYGLDLNNHIRAGITLEKDPGEELFRNSNRAGFDFNSAYIMIHDIGPLKSALLGDFRLGFGQGLTISNGTAPGKSAMPLSIVKRGNEIRTYTSADENDFFRGAAASAGLGRVTLTGFYSHKQRDANITDTLDSGMICFSSFQESGYHRTASEITDEKAVGERAYGGNITFRGNFFHLGTTLVQYHLDKYLEAGDEVKDIHDFGGQNLLNWGVDYSVGLKKIQFFGETAYGNHAWATLNGVLLSVNKYASFALMYRNYGAGYFSLHADAFSEGSSDLNEEAVYAGLEVHPVRKLKIAAYADFYRFPWLRYQLSAPASGSDYLLQADYFPGKQVEMYIRIKHELDPEDEWSTTQILPVVIHRHHTGIRYHISYLLVERLSLQSRLEMIRVKPGADKTSLGFLIYQDAGYRARVIPMNLDFRFAWFQTDDYSSRIYAYEQDLSSGFTFSPLYNKGFRTYLMVRYAITPSMTFRLRLAHTHFFQQTTLGSGYDEIDGNTRNEIKMQLTARF